MEKIIIFLILGSFAFCKNSISSSACGRQFCKIFFTLFCREALTDIFDRCDLDGNGYLSREEFDFFQMKSGGEQCDDDAWEIMKGNCQKKKNFIMDESNCL